MSLEARLSRLSPSLSARERAILVLNSWKEGKQEDPSWRRGMPQGQAHEFNRYIGLMNVANVQMRVMIRVLKQYADEAGLRFAWLTSLILWQEHVDEIRRAIRVAVRQPITERDYAALVAKNRAQWVDIEELAALLAGREANWTDEDYVKDEDGEEDVSEEAWERECAAKEHWLRERVAAGSLPAKGKGKRLRIQEGAFEDLTGYESGAMPEDDEGHLFFRVLPDEQAEQVGTDRDLLKRLHGVLDWKRFHGDTGARLPKMPDYMLEAVKEGLALKLIGTWIEIRSVEQVLDEMAPEFDGADPLKPESRAMLEEAKREVLSLQEQLRVFHIEVELREPLAEELEELREFVANVT